MVMRTRTAVPPFNEKYVVGKLTIRMNRVHRRPRMPNRVAAKSEKIPPRGRDTMFIIPKDAAMTPALMIDTPK